LSGTRSARKCSISVGDDEQERHKVWHAHWKALPFRPMQDFAQFLAVLLSLSDFGLSANPKAPPPAEVIRHGADGAELFFYVDVEAVLPRTHRALVALADKPAVKSAPQAR